MGSVENSILDSVGLGKKDEKQYNDKVDLNDLDWEDRERVLRLLFSKMNAGVPTNALKVMARQTYQQQKSSKVQQMLDYSSLPAPNSDE